MKLNNSRVSFIGYKFSANYYITKAMNHKLTQFNNLISNWTYKIAQFWGDLYN